RCPSRPHPRLAARAAARAPRHPGRRPRRRSGAPLARRESHRPAGGRPRAGPRAPGARTPAAPRQPAPGPRARRARASRAAAAGGAAELMRERGGNIVLLGSIDGVKAAPSPVHYAASKGALAGMVKAMAKELGPHNIRVNSVAPGVLEGGLSRALPDELRSE